VWQTVFSLAPREDLARILEEVAGERRRTPAVSVRVPLPTGPVAMSVKRNIPDLARELGGSAPLPASRTRGVFQDVSRPHTALIASWMDRVRPPV